MTLTFKMPDDRSWDPDFWLRIGDGPEWDRLATDFDRLGVEEEDTDDVVLNFHRSKQVKVRALVQAARAGAYGQDIATYWSAAVEVP